MSFVDERSPFLKMIDKRCKFCPGGGLRTQHGLCTDPFGDKGECYCWASNATHRLQHERWAEPDDDAREGADGFGSSRVVKDFEDQAEMAEAWADREG